MATTQTNSSTTNSKPPSRARVLACILCLVLALGLFGALNRLFEPKYASAIFEGAMVAEYYDAPKQNELLIVGDCEVYENISPVTLWEEYGITSYIRGSPQQLIWHSYALLEDALRYETPKAVVFNVLAMKYAEPQNEAYNRLALDGMPLSVTKLAGAKAAMTEEESLSSYAFPLLRYHDRWKELSSEDFRYFFTGKAVSFNGFMMRADVKPMERLPTPPQLADPNLDPTVFAYLDKMRLLCEERGIDFVLIKAPTTYPHWYPEWDKQVAGYAADKGILYINALEEADEIGIDLQTDTYDAGLHLNLAGAEKFSLYLGKILQSHSGLNDKRDDDSIRPFWTEMTDQYQRLKERQLQEIQSAGKVTTLTKEW